MPSSSRAVWHFRDALQEFQDILCQNAETLQVSVKIELPNVEPTRTIL